MKTNSAYCFFVLLLLTSCRFDEGPAISFRSVNHRVAGDWKVESFTANGIDSMSYLRRYNLDGIWSFNKYETNSDPDVTVKADTTFARGIWSTSSADNHESVHITLYNINCHPGSCTQSSTIPDWPIYGGKIIKLKEKDMKLRWTVQGIVYEMHFKSY